MKTKRDAAPSRLGDLILVWLFSKEDGGTPCKISKDLEKVIAMWRSPAEIRKAINDEVVTLTQSGLIVPVRQRASVLTDAGVKRSQAALRVKSISSISRKETMALIRNRYLPACFAEQLDAAERGMADIEQDLSPLVDLPSDDKAFAKRVLDAARASRTGRFGDDKVFVSHVMQELKSEGFAIGDVEAFKARLIAVHRKNLLALNRADLVEAMEPHDVAASEIRYLSATFHFVRI